MTHVQEKALPHPPPSLTFSFPSFPLGGAPSGVVARLGCAGGSQDRHQESALSCPNSFYWYYSKMQARHYSCKNLTLEMDLTNTSAATVQLVPVSILVNYIRISTGLGAIIQTLYSKELWGYLAMTSNNVKMTSYQYITNTAPTTFQSAGTIVAGASVTYNIPLLLLFLVQLDFFLGNLNDLGLTIQVYSRGPGVYITRVMGDITMNASWLRLDAEYYSSAAADSKLAEQKSKPHQWKFLNTAHSMEQESLTQSSSSRFMHIQHVGCLELIKHLANTGFQYLEKSFLNITSAVTATIVVDVYAVCLAILQLSPDGQLSVDKRLGQKKEVMEVKNSIGYQH